MTETQGLVFAVRSIGPLPASKVIFICLLYHKPKNWIQSGGLQRDDQNTQNTSAKNLKNAFSFFSFTTTMSQHSTTTTETHTLIKYSRSYGLGADPHEWQHFVNPVIKVLLEMKKSPKGDLTSVRLRILWLMNSGNDSMDVDKREITFVRLSH